MSCDLFIELYSDYRDGLLDPGLTAEVEAHLAACGCCARYHHVMRRGLEILTDIPSEESSDDFLPRLRHRLYNVDCGVPDGRSRLGGRAALVGVAAVGLLALFWLPFAASVPVEMELPAVSAELPPPGSLEVPSLFRSGPFVTTLLVEEQPYPDGDLPEFEWPPLLKTQSDVTVGTSYLRAETALFNR